MIKNQNTNRLIRLLNILLYNNTGEFNNRFRNNFDLSPITYLYDVVKDSYNHYENNTTIGQRPRKKKTCTHVNNKEIIIFRTRRPCFPMPDAR